MFHQQFMMEFFLFGGLGKFGISSQGMWAKSLMFFSSWQPVAFTLRPIAQLNSKVGKNEELRSPAPAPKTQVVNVVQNLARKSCHTLHKGGVHIALERQSQQHVRSPMATWTPPQRKHQPAHDSGPAGTLWVWQFESCLGNPYQYSQKLEASSRADGYVDGAEYCGDWHKVGQLVLKIPNQTGLERSHNGRLPAALQWLPQPPAAKWWPLSGHWDQQDAPKGLVPHTGWPWWRPPTCKAAVWTQRSVASTRVVPTSKVPKETQGSAKPGVLFDPPMLCP